ncbi:hypothetical protein [Rhodococcus pyridinivorans]
MTPPGPIPSLVLWQDSANTGARANELMRENWLILNECAHTYNAGEWEDPDALEEFRELMGGSLDIERKYAVTRAAEFAETQRQWYTRAFGPDYERELGWDRTSSSPLRRTL